MIEPEYRVISEGRVKPGNDPASVKQHVAGLFKSDAAKVDRLFAGKDVVIKSRIPYEVADKYLNALNRAGLACRVELEKDAGENGGASRLVMESDAGAKAVVGKVQEEELPECPACGYRARDKNDDLIVKYDGMGECPACGIIVSKYLAARERTQEKGGPADSQTGLVSVEENGDGQDQSGRSLRDQVDTLLDRVIDNVSGSAVSSDETDEKQPLSGWPLYWRGCVILSLMVTLLFGWKIGGAAAIVIMPSYWAYFIWTRDRGAVVFYALCTGGGIFLLLGVTYVVRAICSVLQDAYGAVRFKKHFLTTSLVLLLIVSILSLFSPYHMGVLPLHNHTESKNVRENGNAQPNRETPETMAARQLFNSVRQLVTVNEAETGVLSTDVRYLVEQYGDRLNPIERSRLLAAILSQDLFVKAEGDTLSVAVRDQRRNGKNERWHIFKLNLGQSDPEYTQKISDFYPSDPPW